MNSHINFKNKKIAIVGFGIEGKSSAAFLKKQGAHVTILDKSDGQDYLKDLNKFDLVVRSPGIKFSEVQKHVSKDKITSQIKLFFDLSPAKIIGVTGTKGKGTTSSLIYEMLKKQDFDAYLGGNIGQPPIDFLDKLNTRSIVVLELSSFQLEDLKKSPQIAVVLMITQEHLNSWDDANYHDSLEQYIDAKRNILKFQSTSDKAIINRDYPASNESDIHTIASLFYVSRERDVAEQGCFFKDGIVWLRLDGKDTKVIDASDILLPGRHNLENVCAAVMAAHLAGVSKENMIAVLKTFKGLPHRLELVETINGVNYYDDSFSTTPETAIAAIEAFTQPEILILGGSSKNSNFEELGRIISRASKIKAIIGIGLEWARIKEHIEPNTNTILIEGAENMKQIVLAASKIATRGDVVLLSPACASFDMFKNYKDRGEQFKREVLGLKISTAL